MLIPLKQFICDSCKKPIVNIEDGWIEWESYIDAKTDKIVSKNFRICHHNNKCQKLIKHPNCADLPLSDFTGDYAIVQTISMLDIGVYHDPTYTVGSEIENLREFAELQRRLLLPYYEEARQYWNEAINQGYFGDMNEISIYMPSFLKRMIEDFSESH